MGAWPTARSPDGKGLPVSYASYVGRVGALAVALGIGAAVSAGPVAWANGEAPGAKASRSEANSASHATAKPRKKHVKPAAVESRPTTPDRTNGGTRHRAVADRTKRVAAGADKPAAVGTLKARPSAQVSAAAAPVAAAAVATPVVAQTAAAQTTGHVALSFPRVLSDAVGKIVNAVLAPFARPIPTTPSSSPILLLVEWFRRSVIGTFYNRGPSAAPMQIGEDSSGVVIGTLGATDPDGDPLKFAVSQAPTRGSVVVAANGTYTYTPDADLARDGGTDTFTVKVSDVGLRLLSQVGKSSVTVTVDVGAGDALGINGTPFAIAMSPDGKRAYVTDSANNRVSVVDIATRSVMGSIAVGNDPSGIAIASDGRAYVVNAGDGTVTVFDTATNRVVRPYVYVGSDPTGIAVNAAGTRVVVANSYEGSVSVIDAQTWNVTRVAVGDGPYGVAISGDRALITNEYDNTVSVLDLTTNSVVATIAVGLGPTGIAAAGNRAVVTNAGTLTTPGDGTVSIIDLDTLSVVGSPISVGDSPASVVIDGGGTRAYIADVESSTVSVLDIAAAELTGSTYAVAGGPSGLAIGADGSLYVAGYLSGTIDPLDVGAVAPATSVVVSGGSTVVPVAATTASGSASTPKQKWSTVTMGFDIYNDTAQNLTISYGSVGRPNGGGPAEGTVLAPGAHLHLEIPAESGAKSVDLLLTDPDDEVRKVHMSAKSLLGAVWGEATATPTQLFAPAADRDEISLLRPVEALLGAGSTTVRVRDPAKTVKTVTADDPIAADMLKQCASGSGAKCTFRPTGDPTELWSDWRTPVTSTGEPAIYANGMDYATSWTFDLAFTQAGKAMIGVGVKSALALAYSVVATVKTPDGKSVSSVKTYVESPTFEVPHFRKLTLSMRTASLLYTGTMTITSGNSTVVVTDVAFEFPDPNRGPEYSEKLERMY